MLVKDKEARRLSKVKISIMRNPKFALWSGLMTVGKTKVDDDCPTACTNGRDETYGREFIKQLDDKELAFVVLHETMHKAYRHLTTWKKLHDEDARLANAACDYVINLQLVDMDKQQQVLAMPLFREDRPDLDKRAGEPMGLVDEKYRGLNAKQVFDLLKQEQQANGGGGGFDDHDWDGASELSDEEQKALEKEIDQAIRQGMVAHAKANGKGMGDVGREFGELTEPEVDWREQLREFVTATCSAKDASSWRRVNRRYIGNDIYMPSLIGERVGHLVIGVDTSGSIGGAELNDFMSEVKGVADMVHPEKVDLIYWGSSVVQHEEYAHNELDGLMEATKPKGGGGTDPDCMAQYLKEKNIKPEAIIVLTDGCVPNWGFDWQSPVLWVVANNRGATADNGKTIHIR
jgi:predicted metal-dependent peptidase